MNEDPHRIEGDAAGAAHQIRQQQDNLPPPFLQQYRAAPQPVASGVTVNMVDRALAYIERGWSPLPIPARSKAPRIRGWQKLRITVRDAPKYFNAAGNIGIILGEASRCLVDLDLDWREASDLACKLLPKTDAIFGRTTKPSSHQLYYVAGPAPTIQLRDPVNDEMIVELRGDGGQTVFPGSIHESGEPTEWVKEGEPAAVSYATLCKSVKWIAACCLIKRYFHSVTDYESLINSLNKADPRHADRVREWLELPQPFVAEKSDLLQRSSTPSPLDFLGPRPAYLPVREKGQRLAERSLRLFARNDLNDCVRELKNKKEPGRANLLYKKAIRMGVMIARGGINRIEVANALYEACDLNGLVEKNGEVDVRRQIERGFKTGEAREQENDFAQPLSAPTEKAPPISATPFKAFDFAKIPPRQWLYGRHYVRKYVTATVAPGGGAKTALKITEAVSMAIGRDLLDSSKPIDRLRVWYWNGEDPREEIKRRIAAGYLHYKINPMDLEGWLFVDSGHDMPIRLATEYRGTVKLNEEVIDAVRETLERNKIDVMVIDPFISIHAVSENNNPLIDQVVKLLGGIANAKNCSIEIVHHVRKPSMGQHEITADDTRGGGAIVNAVGSCQVLNRMSIKEAEQARIEQDERFRYFRVDSGKQNLAPPEKAKWRYLESVDLPNGDNVQVVEFWQFPETVNAVTQEEMEFIRATAREGIHNRWDTRAKYWIGRALANRLGLDAQNKADREDIKTKLNACRKSGMIAVETRLDASRQPREFVVANEARGPAPDMGPRQGDGEAQQ